MSKLLIVDDEQTICWGLSRLGKSLGHDVATASSAEQAIATTDRYTPDVIVLDVRLPGMDGLQAIEHLRARCGNVPIVVITAFGDLQIAVDALRSGAFEYIVKPFDLAQIQRVIERALDANRSAAPPLSDSHSVAGLVGASPEMQHVFKRIALVAASDASALVHGESGTGKELVARAIHRFSRRSAGPFVAVSVAALSASLAESELFGHVRGAFTGADAPHIGLLAQANGGTLFLDELAEIPLPLQVKLLRALEYGEVTPVGAEHSIQTDFRVISATHQDLLRAVREGRFRHDLYFRLCTFQIDLPPLRDRASDIRALAEHFISEMRQAGEPAPRPLIAETVAELQHRPWFGNVRELRNAIQHGLILARGGPLLPEHLPPAAPRTLPVSEGDTADPAARLSELIRLWSEAQLTDPAKADDLYEKFLAVVEPPLLEASLAKHRGQCAAAARTLGLHRTTLRKKLDQYGIDGGND